MTDLLNSMTQDRDWPSLSKEDQEILTLAAPFCGPGVDPVVAARNARFSLWEKEIPTETREHVAHLVYLQNAKFFTDLHVIQASMTVKCKLLGILQWALGKDASELRARALRANCWVMPRRFPNDYSRVETFARKAPYALNLGDQTTFKVVIMGGIPGCGKSYWTRTNCPSLPLVSLDETRIEMGVSWDDPQDEVVEATYYKAAWHLTKGESFIWDATNLVKAHRQRIISMCREAGAYVEFVFVDAPKTRCLAQNAGRGNRAVPEDVIIRMAQTAEMPDIREVHNLLWVWNDW